MMMLKKFIMLTVLLHQAALAMQAPNDASEAVEAAKFLIEEKGFHQFNKPFHKASNCVEPFNSFIAACRRNFVDAVDIFLKSDMVKVDRADSLALIEASRHGSLEVVRKLLEDGRVQVNVKKCEALVVAAEGGHLEVVLELLKADRRAILKPVDSPYGPHRAVTAAIQNGHEEVFDALLADPRINPSFEGNQPLRVAAHAGKVDMLRKLLAHPSVQQAGRFREALDAAIQAGHENIVKVLLDSGVCTAQDGLEKAIRRNNRGILIELLKRDAHVNVPLPAGVYALRGPGQSALQLAAGLGHQDLVVLMRIFPALVLRSGQALFSDIIDILGQMLANDQ